MSTKISGDEKLSKLDTKIGIAINDIKKKSETSKFFQRSQHYESSRYYIYFWKSSARLLDSHWDFHRDFPSNFYNLSTILEFSLKFLTIAPFLGSNVNMHAAHFWFSKKSVFLYWIPFSVLIQLINSAIRQDDMFTFGPRNWAIDFKRYCKTCFNSRSKKWLSVKCHLNQNKILNTWMWFSLRNGLLSMKKENTAKWNT